jgi:hypothetical protein
VVTYSLSHSFVTPDELPQCFADDFELGFREFSGGPSPHERCDIQMELWLQSAGLNDIDAGARQADS